MVEEVAKKFAVGDMPPSPTTSNPISNTTTSHKKPTRHHVKRRSSGRVHVTKLAPMARAHTPQPTNEDDDNFEDVEQQQQQQQQQQHAPRKPMKRSHSSKSIHRLSSNDPHRKVNLSGFTMTSKSTTPASTVTSQTVTHDSPPITPTEQQLQQKQQNSITADSTSISQVNTKSHVSATPVPPTKSVSTQKCKPITSPSFQVSHQSPAAPLAHILNATANTLVTPDKPALVNLTTPSTTTAVTASTGSKANSNDNSDTGSSKSKHLYSRFVQQQGNRYQDSIEGHQQLQEYHQHQQQHHHQHQQYQQQTHHKYQQLEQMAPMTSADALIRVSLAIASNNVDKEYQIIQDYQDPMVASLTRCIRQRHQQQQQKQQRNISNSKPTSTQLHLHRLAQMGAQQRTFSSSILPTMATLSSQSSAAALLPTPSTGRYNLGSVNGTPTAASNCQQQHIEHRQLARQRHQRLQAAHLSSPSHYTTSVSSNSSENKQVVGRWSAGAFLDRMFYGTS